MADTIESQIPSFTGPGAFFIALIIIALWITSSFTRNTYLINNPPLIVGLVALSIPFSVFFVQVFHSLYNIFGYRKLYGSDFSEFVKKSSFQLDCLVDYLSYENEKEKQWGIIYRKAQGRNLFGTLFVECVIFLILYSGFLFGDCKISAPTNKRWGRWIYLN